MGVPDGYRVAESHEWAKVEGDLVLVGITDHAVEQLGDLTFIDLPAVGDDVIKGEQFGEIESVKAVSELYAPCSGVVTEVNSDLSDDLSGVAEDPFSEDDRGWMSKITPSNTDELDHLLEPDAYEKHASEGH
jgi:glycine cleavage system H protein